MDMTEEGKYSLSEQTVTMLKRLEKPVHITFFHDPIMRETVELYELMARQTDKLTLEFFDPMLNPAQARMRGVQFAGTSILASEGRKMQISGSSETDIANAILRVSLGVTQKVCFLDGHREPDPFSIESHDHMEGTAGHSHGLGAQYVLHEQHGMAKARSALETLNYTVEKISLSQQRKFASAAPSRACRGRARDSRCCRWKFPRSGVFLPPAATDSSCSTRSSTPAWRRSSGNTASISTTIS